MRAYKSHCQRRPPQNHPTTQHPPDVSNEVLCQIEFARNYKIKNARGEKNQK